MIFASKIQRFPGVTLKTDRGIFTWACTAPHSENGTMIDLATIVTDMYSAGPEAVDITTTIHVDRVDVPFHSWTRHGAHPIRSVYVLDPMSKRLRAECWILDPVKNVDFLTATMSATLLNQLGEAAWIFVRRVLFIIFRFHIRIVDGVGVFDTEFIDCSIDVDNKTEFRQLQRSAH